MRCRAKFLQVVEFGLAGVPREIIPFSFASEVEALLNLRLAQANIDAFRDHARFYRR